MSKREIKKCVLEILDTLYERNGFAHWWDHLNDEIEKEITAELESIIERRLNQNKDDEQRIYTIRRSVSYERIRL